MCAIGTWFIGTYIKKNKGVENQTTLTVNSFDMIEKNRIPISRVLFQSLSLVGEDWCLSFIYAMSYLKWLLPYTA